jgi:hypothetical protein
MVAQVRLRLIEVGQPTLTPDDESVDLSTSDFLATTLLSALDRLKHNGSTILHQHYARSGH